MSDMKKLLKKASVLVSLLILISCQNDLDDSINKIGADMPQTKSSVNVPSVLSQLSGIPVNIILKNGNKNYSYLSTNTKNNAVDLHNTDDGSLKQRWLITSKGQQMGGGTLIELKVEGGAHTNGYLTPIGSPGNYVPKLVNSMPIGVYMREGEVESTYYIFTQGKVFPQPLIENLYSVDAVNRGLAFADKNKSSGRDLWEIVPVESFKILDIKYAQEVTDRVIPSLQFIRAYNMNNINGPSPLTHTYTVSEEYTETSSFTKTEGLTTTSKISNSASFKIGLPFIKGDGSIDTSITTEKKWTYSDSETTTHKKNISDSFTYSAPPYTNVRIELYLMTYDLDVTYIMTLQGNVSGRTIKLKGKWEGVQATEITYEPKIVKGNTNQIIPKVEGKLNKTDYEQMYINK